MNYVKAFKSVFDTTTEFNLDLEYPLSPRSIRDLSIKILSNLEKEKIVEYDRS
jgi:hypothetical protein|tara:strand:+ start:221 stop:379 length:159 start_codon:yes stop_codon:yes gene_type:complete